MFGEKLKTIADKLVDIYKRGYGEGYAANGGTAGLSYALSEDETYYICDGIGTASETDIVIASSYNTRPVKKIKESAFINNKSIKSVFIPDTVTIIDTQAFYGCSAMTNLWLGTGVERIYNQAFRNCTSLTSVTLPDSITILGSSVFRDCTGLKKATVMGSLDGECAFYNCTSLESVKLHRGDIGAYAFSNCTSLESVSIPYAPWIKHHAFAGCSAMKRLRIESALWIQHNAFNNCTALEEIYYNAGTVSISDSANKIFANAGRNSSGIKLTIGADVQSIPNYLFCPDVSNYDLHPYINSIEFEEGCQCTSIGDYAFFRLAIKNINIPATVRSIGSNAFYNCHLLASIAIPDSVTSIGEYAFAGSYAMESLSIGTGVKTVGNYAFADLTNLQELYFNATNMDDLTDSNLIFEDSGTSATTNGLKLVIGANVTKIPAYLYYVNSADCPNITSIEFEVNSQCTSIGNYGFANANVESILIPDTVTSIGDYAFAYSDITSITIPDNVTSIGSYAFRTCSALETVKVGNGVASIGLSAFEKCNALEGVYITDIAHWCGIAFENAAANPLSIGHNLYLNDELVYSLVIPEGVTSIGDYAFYHCLSIVSFTIPDTVTEIGTDVFKNCAKVAEGINKSSLDSPITPSIEEHSGETKVKNVEGYLFYNYNGQNYLVGYAGSDTELTLPVDYNGENYTINSSAFINDRFTSVTIVSGVSSIKYGAFRYCSKLVSVEMSDSVNSLGTNMFAYCSSLTNVTLSKSIENIPNNTFLNCISLKEINIHEGVTNIGVAAFSNCSGLTSVIIPDSVTSIGMYAFRYCYDLAKVLMGSGVSREASNIFEGCNNLYNIYCKFADGAFSNAPWGAVNATIAYNATIDDYNSEV